MTPKAAVAVGVGGMAGASTRWALVEVLPATDAWPWGVLAVNLAGCLLLGLSGRSCLVGPGPPAGESRTRHRLCGSLTTFSALTVDVADMARDGDWGYAAGYLAVSVAGGLALAIVGVACAKPR